MLTKLMVDRKFRLARHWSNRQIARFAPLFEGRIINVSAWKDEDKEGRCYRDYFTSAASYHLSNFKTEARGLQGQENEIFLDLTVPLPSELEGQFDCVFNHTTLEHIYDVQVAMANICRMSRDAVIVVVPFLQQMHGDYGDYWRFTPTCLQKMFEQNGLTPLYTSYNNHFMASVYILMIAVRDPVAWDRRISSNTGPDGRVPHVAHSTFPDPYEHFIGCNAVPSAMSGLAWQLRTLIGRARGWLSGR